jgi:hypothetical protein
VSGANYWGDVINPGHDVGESSRVGRTATSEFLQLIARMCTISSTTLRWALPAQRRRLEKRMESLQRVKLASFEVVISELETELDYLRRATRHLEE